MNKVTEISDTANRQKSRDTRFIDAIINRCAKDKGAAARLRRSDNPATEYQSWEILGELGIDIEKDWMRLPYTTVAANVAKSKTTVDGDLTLGAAIAGCFTEGQRSDQAKARLRRLLACTEIGEVCRFLRPTLTLIFSRVNRPLNFTRLLGQLRKFYFDPDSVKAQWAQEFYRTTTNSSDESEAL